MQAVLGAAVIPFQIMVAGRGPGGPYTLRAMAAGRSAEAELELPPLPEDGEALGQALGRLLFPPPIRSLLLDVARGADEAGARLQIQLQVGPAELAGLPWEWASLGQSTPWRPALRDDYALVRVGRGPQPRPALTVAGPLRLLIACAPGCEAAAASLGHALAEPVRAGLLAADLLRDATPEELAAALDEEPCHLLHIVAPADAHRGEPRLRLGRALDAAGLAGLLDDLPGVRLVTFAGEGGPAHAALAAALSERAGVAAIGLGGVAGGEAARFAAACYAGLAAGDPADLAATDGRAALAEASGPWGAPQVHLGPGGEQLFRLRPEAPAPAGRAPAAARAAPEADSVAGTRAPVHPRPARPPRPELRRKGAGADEGSLPRASIPWPRLALPALPAAMSRPASRFAVQQTAVGAPARRADEDGPRRLAISPRLLLLVAAVLVLGLMVSRVLQMPTADAAPGADAPASVLVPAMVPTLQAQASAAVAQIGAGGPLSAAAPQGYSTYVVAEGDTAESIARRAGSDPAAIVAFNFLNPGDQLRPGRPLVLPLYGQGEALPQAPIINRGSPDRPQVALTFDIEIDDATLYAILDILRERGLKGTFFLTGGWIKSFPEAAKAIAADGHEIGNHSLTHPAFSNIGSDGALHELEATEQIVREVTGRSSRPYFRFPYGASSPEMVELLAGQGYVAYHWSADDYAIPSWIAQATASPAQAYGGILLMHGRQSTVDALPGWLDQLAAAGLQPTTLGEVLR